MSLRRENSRHFPVKPADLLREFAWRARNRVTISPPVVRFPFLACLRGDVVPPQAQPDYERLGKLYELGPWHSVCSPLEFQENLYVLDVLDRHLGTRPGPGRGLDIGCKNWSYVPALYAWSGGAWDGVELDAHRRYATLVTRRAYGEYMAAPFPGCRYIPGSLLDVERRYSVVTWFLPFVRVEPLLAWGLPRRFFEPLRLLRHAWERVLPGGRMLVVNQGRGEAEIQQELFRKAEIPARFLGEIVGTSSPFKKARFGWLAEKPR